MTFPSSESAHAFSGVPDVVPRTPVLGTADPRTARFVSKMHMHSQYTSEETIQAEQDIIRAQPDVADADYIVYDDEGWDSRVFVINGGETCYKFPRSAEVMAGYESEIVALSMIGSLDTGVRTQRFKVLDSTGRFFSYYGLVGTQLSELLGTIDISEKQRIGSLIGEFLKLLHASELQGAPVVTIADEIKEYQAKYQLALPVIEANFSTTEQKETAEFFFDYMPEEMEGLGGEIRLCHGDLGAYNIIIGDNGVPGIIDFGNAGYYEHSKDFIDFGDQDVLNAVYGAYGDSSILRAKTAVRMTALPATDLVYYMGKSDKHGVSVTLGRLRELLQASPHIETGAN